MEAAWSAAGPAALEAAWMSAHPGMEGAWAEARPGLEAAWVQVGACVGACVRHSRLSL